MRESNLRKTKSERNGEPVLSAKSRRDDKPIFEFPEFDKEEYIAKEFRDAKVSRMVILLAFVIALVSYAFVRIDESYRIVGLLLIFLAVAELKEFYRLIRVDTSAFEKKNWIGNSLLLFFAWFGMFTLLLNPPFYDMIDPRVESIDVWTIGTNETSGNITYILDETPTLALNTNISINATAVDNSKVDHVILEIRYPGNNDTANPDETRGMLETGNEDDEYTGGTLKLAREGTYTFRVIVEDNFGNTGELIHSVRVESQ